MITLYSVEDSGELISRKLYGNENWYERQRCYESRTKLGAFKLKLDNLDDIIQEARREWNNAAENIKYYNDTRDRVTKALELEKARAKQAKARARRAKQTKAKSNKSKAS